jgi:hypothetical protein
MELLAEMKKDRRLRLHSRSHWVAVTDIRARRYLLRPDAFALAALAATSPAGALHSPYLSSGSWWVGLTTAQAALGVDLLTLTPTCALALFTWGSAGGMPGPDWLPTE